LCFTNGERLLLNAPWRPGDHVLTPGEMQQWRDRGQNDSRGFRHRIAFEICLRRLQKPRRMMNLAAIDAAAMRRIQAIPLGQKVFQRS